MEVTSEHLALLAAIQPYVIPWRRMTIAVDGLDGSGKSTLARFLAWQLGMPVVETDMALLSGNTLPVLDNQLLDKLIGARHGLDRPVIVEGVFVLRTLGALQISPEILVRVDARGWEGSHLWRGAFQDYAREYPRAHSPDFRLSWVPNDAS